MTPTMIRAGDLACGYLERGPADGVPVMLLHVVEGSGHFLQRERPAAVLEAVRTSLRRDVVAARKEA
jgi:pimeloyl-ACP methyl ester carboxylesterase